MDQLMQTLDSENSDFQTLGHVHTGLESRVFNILGHIWTSLHLCSLV